MFIYVIMKTMYPPGYHHNGFLATHALMHLLIQSFKVGKKSLNQITKSKLKNKKFHFKL